jgi:hypothetical protein
MQARHRLSKLLLRHGIVYYGGLAWTGKHDLWLRTEALARLGSRATRLTFDADYETVLVTKARRDRLDEAIEQMAADSEFTPLVRRLGCLRGIGTLTGFALPYLQCVQHHDAQGTGVRLLPMVGALIAGAACSEMLANRVGVKFVLPSGMMVSAGGLLLLAQVPAEGGYGGVLLALVVFGVGLGLSLPLAADAVLAELPPEQGGMGNALSRTLQSISVAIGTAVVGSVLNNTYRHGLSNHLAGVPRPVHDETLSSIAGAHGVAARLPAAAGRALIHAADTSYTRGLSHAALACCVLLRDRLSRVPPWHEQDADLR